MSNVIPYIYCSVLFVYLAKESRKKSHQSGVQVRIIEAREVFCEQRYYGSTTVVNHIIIISILFFFCQ